MQGSHGLLFTGFHWLHLQTLCWICNIEVNMALLTLARKRTPISSLRKVDQDGKVLSEYGHGCCWPKSFISYTHTLLSPQAVPEGGGGVKRLEPLQAHTFCPPPPKPTFSAVTPCTSSPALTKLTYLLSEPLCVSMHSTNWAQLLS